VVLPAVFAGAFLVSPGCRAGTLEHPGDLLVSERRELTLADSREVSELCTRWVGAPAALGTG
jgi:hypothetical protein